MSLADKLTSLSTAKQSIKSALTSKGQDMSTVPFTNYGDTITSLNTTQLFDYCDCYIGVNGSDSNTGTKSSPYKSIQRCLTMGYRIIGVLKGTYTDIGSYFNSYDGGLILIAEEGVILDGNNSTTGYSVFAYTTMINFIFTGYSPLILYSNAASSSQAGIFQVINSTFFIKNNTTSFFGTQNGYVKYYCKYCDFIGESVYSPNDSKTYLTNCYHDTITFSGTTNFNESNVKSSPNHPERLV